MLLLCSVAYQNRKFNLSFDFFARDERSRNIDEIIMDSKQECIQQQMKGTGGVLGFPDLFMLEPWFNDHQRRTVL